MNNYNLCNTNLSHLFFSIDDKKLTKSMKNEKYWKMGFLCEKMLVFCNELIRSKPSWFEIKINESNSFITVNRSVTIKSTTIRNSTLVWQTANIFHQKCLRCFFFFCSCHRMRIEPQLIGVNGCIYLISVQRSIF